MQYIQGGITAVQGFRAAGIHAGIRKNQAKMDVALVCADQSCRTAAVYTSNVVKADCLTVTREHLQNGMAQAIVVNSGNANACAPDGRANAELTCQTAAEVLGIDAADIVVASTGVIGQRLPIEKIVNALPALASKLSIDGGDDAAHAIMTTDTIVKQVAATVEIGGKTVTIGGMAKGSGMIAPNMGTMLAFITTDCAISHEMLQAALQSATRESFNRVVVDGDTSTNDMAVIMASGGAENTEITEFGDDYSIFDDALCALCVKLAIMMASDGEGAQHLITCTVSGASNEEKAEALAHSVISSSLFKAAIFGADANVGRVLCAMGYAGVDFDLAKVDITFQSAAGVVPVCRAGQCLAFDEAHAKAVLTEHDVEVLIDLHEETATGACPTCTCWGCDLTYEYVKINGDYRS